MQITLDIPNNQVTRMVDAFAKYYSYQETVLTDLDGILTPTSNPMSKGQFAKQQLIEHIKNIVTEVERQKAIESITTPSIDVT